MSLIIKNGKALVRDERTGEQTREASSNPLHVIQKLVDEKPVHNIEFRFTGGAVGYFSYDAIRYWEKLPVKANDDLNFPDAEFGFFDDGIIFDHRQRCAFYYYSKENRLPEIETTIKQPEKPSSLRCKPLGVNVTKERFEKAVEKTKEHITKGDIFQAVLSKRFAFNIHGDLVGFYRSLREINPSPYMYFIKMGDRQIVGASPEMLVRVDNRLVETFPIAGTRPFTGNPSEDRRLGRELLADPKERAEHVMLVMIITNMH